MAYNRLQLSQGDVLSDVHINHMEDGIDNVVKQSDVFKKKMASIVSAKGIPTYETDSLDKIVHNINLLGVAVTHNDEVDENMIDIRKTCPSGCIQLLCSDERTARVRFTVWTLDSKAYTVNWGDGTSNTYNNGQLADHTYRLGTGQSFKGSNTQFVATISALGGNVIYRFQAYDNPEILWFASKDVYFTNIDCMFSRFSYTDGYSPQNMKYVDIIGGSLKSANTSATGVFRSCKSLERITGVIDLSTATKTEYMFSQCSKLVNIPDVLDISQSTSTYQMFYNCSVLQKVPDVLDLRKSENCSYMYYGCYQLRALPEVINLESCTNIHQMFYQCKALSRVPELKNATNVTDAYNAFYGCEKLEEVYPILNLPNCTRMEGMYDNCVSLIDAPSTINMTSVENIDKMFLNCSSLQTSPRVINAPNCKIANRVFAGCASLVKAPVSVSIPMATSCYGFFENCKSLKETPSEFNAQKSLAIYNMFAYCSALISANISIVADKAENVSALFRGCISLAQVANEFSFPSATNASWMFYGNTMLKQAPDLILPKARDLSQMFGACSNLVEIKTYNFPEATNLNYFYDSCKLIEVAEEIIAPKAITTTFMLAYTASLREIKSIGGPNVQDADAFMTQGSLANLTKIPSIIDFSSVTNLNNWGLCTGGTSFIEMEEVTFIGLRCGLDFYGHPGVKKIRIQNQSNLCQNINVSRCGMNTDAINTLFEDLVRTNVGRTIHVTGNPGAATCNTSIATAKGWSVAR